MGMDSAERSAQTLPGHLLAEELARNARTASAALPVLRHLLASDGPSLVNEAVVARVRGMLRDLAAQIVTGGRGALASDKDSDHAIESLAQDLGDDEGLLAHIHVLALESQLAERFEQRLSLDPVLSPLLQELIASDDAMVAELAMTTLASQARFMQSQRRMELPLLELPAELFAAAISRGQDRGDPVLRGKLALLASTYDESATRFSLMGRLVVAMRGAVIACLAFDRAGLALFSQGLAQLSGMTRAEALLSCHDNQAARLALGLRAAGLELAGIDRQMRLVSAPGDGLHALSHITRQQAREQLASALNGTVPGRA